MNGFVHEGETKGNEIFLSLRSFGNEQIHSSHFAWESEAPR